MLKDAMRVFLVVMEAGDGALASSITSLSFYPFFILVVRESLGSSSK